MSQTSAKIKETAGSPRCSCNQGVHIFLPGLPAFFKFIEPNEKKYKFIRKILQFSLLMLIKMGIKAAFLAETPEIPVKPRQLPAKPGQHCWHRAGIGGENG